MNARRTLTAGLAATALAAGLTTTAALAPTAGPGGGALSALAPQAAQADDAPTPSVQVHEDGGANGVSVARAINELRVEDRGQFVQDAVAKAFEVDGGDYNVVMQNLSQGYDKFGLEGVKLFATVQWGSIQYGLWIAEAGTFKNTGDGGYINWAFQGWFDRPDDQTVVFKRP
jgi:hypothetical protein